MPIVLCWWLSPVYAFISGWLTCVTLYYQHHLCCVGSCYLCIGGDYLYIGGWYLCMHLLSKKSM